MIENQCTRLLSKHPLVIGLIDSQQQYLLAISETAHIDVRKQNRR